MLRRELGLSVALAIGCGSGVPAATAPGPAGRAGGLEQCTFASGGNTPDNAAELLPWPTKSIADLKGVTSGGYNTEGDVEDVFVPSACPPGEICTDQTPHVIVNEKSREEWVTNPRQLAVIVRDPTKLKSGVRYKMSIAVCGTRQMGASVNEGEMRAFVQVVK
jgi:hypothetical protein